MTEVFPISSFPHFPISSFPHFLISSFPHSYCPSVGSKQ